MASTTVNQFRKLFPASVAPSSLLNGKVPITVKLKSYWGDKTVDELAKFVDILDVPGRHLHLYQIKKGCIAVISLCSITDAQKLKGGIWRASRSLQMMGVSELFVGVVPMMRYSTTSAIEISRRLRFVSDTISGTSSPSSALSGRQILAGPGIRVVVALVGTLVGGVLGSVVPGVEPVLGVLIGTYTGARIGSLLGGEAGRWTVATGAAAVGIWVVFRLRTTYRNMIYYYTLVRNVLL